MRYLYEQVSASGYSGKNEWVDDDGRLRCSLSRAGGVRSKVIFQSLLDAWRVQARLVMKDNYQYVYNCHGHYHLTSLWDEHKPELQAWHSENSAGRRLLEEGGWRPIVDQLLVILLEQPRNLPIALSEAGYSHNQVAAAWREARSVGWTEPTTSGTDRLTAAGKARAIKVRARG